MHLLQLKDIVIFAVLCITKQASTELPVPLPKSLDLETNKDQANNVVANSNTDITNYTNIGNIIRDEIKAQLGDLKGTLKDLESSDEEACLRDQKLLGGHYNLCKKSYQHNYPKNCKEVQENGNKNSGIYQIYPANSKEPFAVLCDMETDGGGWTVIQRRIDGSQDFSLPWRNYKFGFGSLDGEFWLGLEKIHILTGYETTELLVELVDRDGVTDYGRYNSFAVGPEPEGYRLNAASWAGGVIGDSLNYHLGQNFSTIDLDWTQHKCGTVYGVGWWYKECYWSNLNSNFINIELPDEIEQLGMNWGTYKVERYYCLAKARMLVRPAS